MTGEMSTKRVQGFASRLQEQVTRHFLHIFVYDAEEIQFDSILKNYLPKRSLSLYIFF